MVGEKQVEHIISELIQGLSGIFPHEKPDAVLFGSYARGEQEEGSDIDVLLLVDAPREVISCQNWEVGNVAAEILFNYGVLVSPIVENREYFNANAEVLPFYRNIRREGVHIRA